jgi:ribose 5-phosphate isomerase A
MLAIEPMPTEDESIWSIAAEAAEMVRPGTVIGLGTGRAASMFVRALSVRVREGLSIRGVATSLKTERLAKELAIPLARLDEVEALDLDVDGADEVDPALDLIKGHGGALLRERVVASISKRFVILAGEEKLVPRLGARMAVPVEVVPFAAPVALRKLAELGGEARLRMAEGAPFLSDNGNHILDARFDEIKEPAVLGLEIDALPGVVDHGLFVGMADLVLIQAGRDVRRLERPGR